MIETAQNPERNGADPHTQAVVGDSSFSELVESFRSDFAGSLSAPDTGFLAEQIFDWFMEKGLLIDHGDKTNFNAAQWQTAFLKIMAYELQHPALTDLFAVRYIWNEPLLDDLIGHLTPSQYAAKINVTREAVNKAVLRAQKEFKQAPRAGQRDKNARSNMSKARRRQLNPATPTNHDPNRTHP
jgi:hypothetical protein